MLKWHCYTCVTKLCILKANDKIIPDKQAQLQAKACSAFQSWTEDGHSGRSGGHGQSIFHTEAGKDWSRWALMN